MKASSIASSWGALIFFALSLFIPSTKAHGQSAFNYFYRVYFFDKGADPSAFQPSELLSSAAISRRQKNNLPVLEMSDLPVNRGYLDQIRSMGFVLHSTSKWMNTALFKTQNAADINLLLNLPFVSTAKIVRLPVKKGKTDDKLYFETGMAGQYPYDRPVTMLNGYTLHNSGFTGRNILIAVLDGGFRYADKIEALSSLRSREGIIATYDFVNKREYVYDASNHGTAVTSILAGDVNGYLAGIAPSSDYLLLRTEDTSSEFPCEEDYWVAGAEYADSAGADIISSSLGYFSFDDPSMNYRYSDLNGNTAFITRAAGIAASKGILVVNSAGNERDNSWRYIITPADGDLVVAVGAVDENEIVSGFSSAGPTYDGRIKPDVSAMGVAVPLQTDPGFITRGSGTSFSCPVISGLSACLMQAVPEASNNDVINALRSSSDRYSNPDSLYGFGIPDMASALELLQDKFINLPDDDLITVPNPTRGSFDLVFRQSPGSIRIEIYTVSGKLVFRKDHPDFAGRIIRINELQYHGQGMYILKVKGEEVSFVKKIIKLLE